MKITYHGHSCVSINTGEFHILIDPFITGNPLSDLTREEVQKLDYIILSHGHDDHVGDTIPLAKQTGAMVIAPFELATYLQWQDVETHPLQIGGGNSFPFGDVKFTQAFHGSGYTIPERKEIIYMGMPAGILLTAEGKTIYHAGDTGLFQDMKMIGELHSITLACLPIGGNFTMDPDDAVYAAQWLKAEQVLPIHYNTFPVIQQDEKEYIQKIKELGISGVPLQPGESLEL
ncbi:metal-dependent hydrolase [Rubeoparvulum massiliense]|uniref:metal-dependent hydrolase n=1 Tax=Rubeoparvulum massiliense TaxID=1631346 RepID=UPI00065E4237|nr:metal-dependent hydrolase [Rubeoparvulum massiliense]